MKGPRIHVGLSADQLLTELENMSSDCYLNGRTMLRNQQYL